MIILSSWLGGMKGERLMRPSSRMFWMSETLVSGWCWMGLSMPRMGIERFPCQEFEASLLE